MNPNFQRLMNEAAQMTRSGQLMAATQAIQRALRGDADEAAAPAGDARLDELRPTARDNHSIVLDGLVRVIDEATAKVSVPAPAHDPAIERWSDASFTHGGRSVAYKLYVPPLAAGSTATPRPLVLMLHGCTQNPADFAAGTRMNALAREQGFIVLYPAQTQRGNAQRCWNWFKTQHQQRGRGEPALLAALTLSIMACENIDPARVYVAGLSAGGAMADILGRCYPELFAAVGVHSGLPAGAASDLPSALAAMQGGPTTGVVAAQGTGAVPPVIVFHGDADATVHPRNGAALVSAAQGSSNGGAAPRVSEGRSAQGQGFTRSEHLAGDGSVAVEHWRLHGAGHAWSGGSAQGSFTDPRGWDASAEMLRFFLAHPKKVQG
ncbi:MAG: PHB depolymerase family esterase [Rhodoferax sp.]|nr:PHB depolymerase family esterase [Rhodoferax sp.]